MIGAHKYKRVYLESAPPARVLDELFLRLLRDIDEACERIDERDHGKKGQAINHALDVVAELTMALDHTMAPEMCANLRKLYVFVKDKLLEANLRSQKESLLVPRQIIAGLREAYKGAADAAGVAT